MTRPLVPSRPARRSLPGLAVLIAATVPVACAVGDGGDRGLPSSGPHARVLVTDAPNDAVRIHDLETGAFLGFAVAPGTPGIDQPLGFTLLPDRSLLVSSDLTDRIRRFDPRTGELLSSFEPTPLVDGPAGLEVGPDGLVYCASGRNGRVLRYTTDGAFVDAFVEGMVVPEMMVWDDAGRFLVGDWWTSRIEAVDAVTGDPLGTFSIGQPLERPLHGHRRDDGVTLVVANLVGNTLARYDIASGETLPTIDLRAGGAPMNGPVDFVDLDDGTMLVSSTNNGRILRYTQEGTYLGVFAEGDGMTGAGALAIWCPLDLDGDERVGFADVIGVLSSWGRCDAALCPADADANGLVDFDDLVVRLASWGGC